MNNIGSNEMSRSLELLAIMEDTLADFGKGSVKRVSALILSPRALEILTPVIEWDVYVPPRSIRVNRILSVLIKSGHGFDLAIVTLVLDNVKATKFTADSFGMLSYLEIRQQKRLLEVFKQIQDAPHGLDGNLHIQSLLRGLAFASAGITENIPSFSDLQDMFGYNDDQE